MSVNSFPFTTEEIDRLENILFDGESKDESFDLFGIHGIMCAFLICPEPIAESTWLEHIVGEVERLTSDQQLLLNELLHTLAEHIMKQLRDGLEIQLPEEVYDNEVAAENWCIGFVEGFLHHENAWFEGQDEPTVAALMLPVMTHSGLFQDDFFKKLHKQDESMAKMLTDIPGNLLDLYLLYQA